MTTIRTYPERRKTHSAARPGSPSSNEAGLAGRLETARAAFERMYGGPTRSSEATPETAAVSEVDTPLPTLPTGSLRWAHGVWWHLSHLLVGCNCCHRKTLKQDRCGTPRKPSKEKRPMEHNWCSICDARFWRVQHLRERGL